MLAVTTLGGTPIGFPTGFTFGLHLGDQIADVTALQTTLRAAGKNDVSVTGSVDGPTVAALFEIVRDKGASLTFLPQEIRDAFKTVQNFDNQLRSFTNGAVDIETVIRDAELIDSTIRIFSDSLANDIQGGLDKFFNAVGSAAGVLNTILGVLTGTGTPSSTSTSTSASATSTFPAGTITTFSKKLNVWRVAIPIGTKLSDFAAAAATHVEVSPTLAPAAEALQVSTSDFDTQIGQPPFFKKPLFWVAIGIGVIAAGSGGYVLYRRRRRLTR